MSSVRALLIGIAASIAVGCAAPVLVVAPDHLLQRPLDAPLRQEVGRIQPPARLVAAATFEGGGAADAVVLLFGATVPPLPGERAAPRLTAEFESELEGALDEAVRWVRDTTDAPPLLLVPERDSPRLSAAERHVDRGTASVMRVPFAEDPVRTADRVRERGTAVAGVIVLTAESAAAIAAGIDPDTEAQTDAGGATPRAEPVEAEARPLLVVELPFRSHGRALIDEGIAVDGAIVYDLAGAATAALRERTNGEADATRPTSFSVPRVFVRY